MSKELEALEKLTNYKCSCMSEKIECKKIIETALKDYENLQLKHRSMQDAVLDDFKKLKALEIIKIKEVNVFIFLHSGDLETYNDMVEDNRKLTLEEYNLLKEILKNE